MALAVDGRPCVRQHHRNRRTPTPGDNLGEGRGKGVPDHGEDWEQTSSALPNWCPTVPRIFEECSPESSARTVAPPGHGSRQALKSNMQIVRENGAGEGIRTLDPNLGKVVL